MELWNMGGTSWQLIGWKPVSLFYLFSPFRYPPFHHSNSILIYLLDLDAPEIMLQDLLR
jgi:hypothetical protein